MKCTGPTPPTPPNPPMVYVEGVCSGRWVRIPISRDVAEADRALYRLLGWAVCEGPDAENAVRECTRLRGIIERAATAFFADGSDEQAALRMHVILREANASFTLRGEAKRNPDSGERSCSA